MHERGIAKSKTVQRYRVLCEASPSRCRMQETAGCLEHYLFSLKVVNAAVSAPTSKQKLDAVRLLSDLSRQVLWVQRHCAAPVAVLVNIVRSCSSSESACWCGRTSILQNSDIARLVRRGVIGVPCSLQRESPMAT